MARVVIGLIIGGVLVMGIASGGEGGGAPQATPAPGTLVDVTIQARAGSKLAATGHCRRGYEIRQVAEPSDPYPWRSTQYRCRLSR